MPVLETKCTKGSSVTVVYPAERPPAYSAVLAMRAGKKDVFPAYSDANLPYLVQFRRGQRIVMFLLSDVLESSYWRRVRNAYNMFGELVLDRDAKLSVEEMQRVRLWLEAMGAVQRISSG